MSFVRKQKKATKKRGPTVTWVDQTVAPKAAPLPRYRPPDELWEDTAAVVPAALKVGAMFTATEDLERDAELDGAYKWPCLKLHQGRPWDRDYDKSLHVLVPKGGVLIYTGEIFVDEQKNRVAVRAVKQTFIGPGGRYILHDINAIRPVT